MEALIGAPSVTFSNNTIYANGTTVAGDPPEYQVADPLYHSLVYVFVESVEVFLQFIGFVVGMWVIRPLTRPGGPKYQGFK